MILDDLYAYYETKPKISPCDRASSPNQICPRYWTVKNVSWEVVFSDQGEFIAMVPLADSEGKASFLPKLLPDISRSSGICAYVFADNAKYVLGLDDSKGDIARADFVEKQHAVLDGVDDVAAIAYLKLVDAGLAAFKITEDEVSALTKGRGTIAFRFEDDPPGVEIQNRPAIAEAWEQYASLPEGESQTGTCLVTGQTGVLSRLFPQVTGVPGAQGAGASLVSFNQPAFISYGQEGASISEDAAFKCGEALRYLLKSPQHRTLMGNDSVVFWTEADTSSGLNLLMLGLCADDRIAQARKSEDKELLNDIKSSLGRIRAGLPIAGVDESDRYHVLGIAPYQARLAIRFYEEGTLGELRKGLEEFLNDTSMVGVEPRSMKSFLEQTAPLGKRENIPAPLITACMRALLKGSAFPASLYEQLLARMRADHASKNSWDLGLRVAMMKAHLVRRDRLGNDSSNDYERRLTMALNVDNDHVGYLLGRLFAELEKVQIDAIGGGRSSNVNATIRDRYMGSAATTPARVFPQLMKLSQHHISKSDYGYASDRRIQEIISKLPDSGSFPKTLDYDQQGEFYIGYYQQKEFIYTSKKTVGDDESEAAAE